jgi:hypothetical protein
VTFCCPPSCTAERFPFLMLHDWEHTCGQRWFYMCRQLSEVMVIVDKRFRGSELNRNWKDQVLRLIT